MWRRPQQIYPDGQSSLWGTAGKPIPNGIQQGFLGDCWFLAACSAVSEEAERIENIFVDKSINSKGIYRLKFWVKDAWYYENVDDRVPTIQWGRSLRAYSTQRSTKNAIWM